MENKRPRSREKHVTGPGKSVSKRGEGLHTGPVGEAGGYQDRRSGAVRSGSGARSSGKGGGGIRLLALLAVLLLGGGGGITALLGGQLPGGGQTGQGGGANLTALLGGLGGGSVSSGWQGEANTGWLNTSVDPAAREKYTRLLGNGRDTATIMVYMCGTDLESRSGMGTADLQEMLSARFGAQINVLIYTGGCTGWRNSQVSSAVNQIWQVKGGSLLCLEENAGSVPMTDPATLSGFIRYCAKNYPASRYELIFWDHGGGSVSGYGYDEKFASSASMGLAGIDKALTDGGVRFDFIGFDACLMATAENALMLAKHGDYLIASEETEPGVGWYYTDWLTAFGADPSMPTLELGRQIADSFVDTCAQKCPGQLTTLSVIDLAEAQATIPAPLTAFAGSARSLIAAKEYHTLSAARGSTREFARGSKIDQVDLVHLAQNLDSPEGNALVEALLGAVKYNRTSSNMTNAYGLSIYFPYQKVSTVDRAVAAYRQIGMDESYTRCIQEFASLEASGQAVSGGTASPLPALLGDLGGLVSSGGGDAVSQLLSGFLGGDFGRIGLTQSNAGFLSGAALEPQETAQYLAEHRFDPQALAWSTGEDGAPVLQLEEEQWALVQSLELNVFYDDGAGYIDLGLDNVFAFDETGGLLGSYDKTWLAIEGQPVAYYHTATVDDGAAYSITGRVPVMHNGQRAELLLTFDNDTPYGYVSGVRAVYTEGETDTIAKSGAALQPGDTLEFLCDYYSYDGGYLDSYLLGEPLTVPDTPLAISNVPLEGTVQATYRFTDLYQQHYWTAVIP
ncbi:peptidase C11 [Pseudoflavonifractor sp. 524-17]|uniref:clostripain-related cysteine peptidase n=1 Tax=Pseudoflavonifractor sp. 524-17 TaxID=2304577 RepID=UPI0013798A98|nr:clostripain-related cysteine peptidase [Pseudoflavonifractor sp. 524-17]NCE64754.1 peptidase C11 [Pseudoflavonifractor sp. 524-17]